LPFFWFITGILFTAAVIVLLLPWLRTVPRLGSLPSLPWQAGFGAVILIGAVLALYHAFGRPDLATQSAAPAAFRSAMTDAGAALDAGASSASGVPASAAAPGSAASSPAGSMNSAIASLEGRLAKGGGSKDDWELLAKSYEFLGRPADAAKARAHELPPLPPDSNDSGASPAAGTSISGEVSLAAALSAKAADGETLFIVAKSIDSPGIPVAVVRSTVGAWPVKFTLDDSKSMFPGRNLSSAGRVTIEARISKGGQPLPGPGDLQGSSGPINPADHPTLKILIDGIVK
jgi:hypothetical protein